MTRYIVTFIKNATTKEVARKGFEYYEDSTQYAVALMANHVAVLRITDLEPTKDHRRRTK